jgi:type IV pilus assembly protein PilN
VLQQMIGNQQSRNEFLQGEIEARHADQGHRHAACRDRRLKARQKAVEDLQTDRNTPVHLLDELVKQTPEGVYLTTIRRTARWCRSTVWRRPTSACPSCCATRSTTRPG